MVSAMRIDRVALVISMSQWRIASTSPIRADVPSITSTITPSYPSGFGPEMARPASHAAMARRIAFTSTGVSASGVCGGR